jgi:hypothetical protein
MYDLLVIAAVIGCAWLGSTKGFHWALAVTLELGAAFGAAVLLHEPLAGLIAELIRLVAESFLPQSDSYAWFALALAFVLLCWAPFAALVYLFHRSNDDLVEVPPLVDRLGGGLVGFVGGVLLAGASLVFLSILPLPSAIKPAPGRMFFDAGTLALRTAARFAPDTHEGSSLLLDGEPASRKSVLSAKLSNEPWCDVDGDSTQTDADRYRDIDGNGAFTADFFFVDVDGDGMRRIGLIDKYVTGCWDSSLNSSPRERTDIKKPAPEQVADAPAAGGEPAPDAGTRNDAAPEFEDDF